MEDLFFVIQLYSYPGDYVAEKPSIERIAETLDKFEEDVLRVRVSHTTRHSTRHRPLRRTDPTGQRTRLPRSHRRADDSVGTAGAGTAR